MRWMVTLVVVMAGVWFLSDRQRRSRVQDTLRGALPAEWRASGDGRVASWSEIAAAAQATWPPAARRAANLTQSAGSTVAQKAGALAAAARRRADGAAAGAREASGGAPDGAQQAAQAAPGQAQEMDAAPFIGNRHTGIFHAATARNLPAEDNRIYFATEEEALAAGFRPAEREGLDDAGEQ